MIGVIGFWFDIDKLATQFETGFALLIHRRDHLFTPISTTLACPFDTYQLAYRSIHIIAYAIRFLLL
jgi:hypothetical protein